MGDANGGPGYGGYGGGYGYGGGRPGPWNQPPSGSPYDQQGSQNAQNLWSQYQGAQPGQGRDDLIRQMQGTDNGAAFNANMKNGGWVRTDSPGGNYSYSQPGGVTDQVQRMQDAQGLNRQGQPLTQQWSSQGNQGGGDGGYRTNGPIGRYNPETGGYGGFPIYGPGGQLTQQYSQGGGYGGYQPGAFGQRPTGYGEPGGFHGQNGQPMQWNGYGQGGGWGGQGGGQPK